MTMVMIVDEIEEEEEGRTGKATHMANGNATPGGRSNTDDDVMAKRLPEADATRILISK